MSKFYNRTRITESIPRKLIKEGKLHLLPIYYLLLTSELAREGIYNSGSYRLADHIYQGIPKGQFLFGRFLDWILLNLKSAQAFRARYLFAKQEIYALLKDRINPKLPIDILAVPSGLGRELYEIAEELQNSNHTLKDKIKWHYIDLDEELINILSVRQKTSKSKVSLSVGDAMLEKSYSSKYDMIISVGLIDFLGDKDALKFLKVIKNKLKDNGRIVTSSLRPHTLSDYLLRNIGEIYTSYRSKSELMNLVEKAEFTISKVYQDKHKLLTMLVAV